ncbi:hypothetical protein DPMN_095151 [Dreissena polymorpha]|uniref:Uncharacterized protein n=1 Tax=Dreissena polymorpha TaxID=45954 RepID=A0A9D4L6C3_DREPO|nr:hypothetical protein DPMN_095151 [Dreissena polymorpha]
MVNTSLESLHCLIKTYHGTTCTVLVDYRTTQGYILPVIDNKLQIACDTGPEVHT